MLRKYIKETYGGLNKNIEEITQDLYKQFKLHSYIYTEQDEKRIIFYVNKSIINYNYFQPSIEANGMVFDDKWDIKCMPCYNFNNSINYEKLNSMIKNDEYTVYTSKDSTVVNLYYDFNRWNIGTTKGVSMNEIKHNNIKYIDMLNDCIYKNFCNYNITEEDLLVDDETFVKKMKSNEAVNGREYIINNFWNNLNKDYTYTLGFRHENIHKFENRFVEERSIYFIQRINIKTLNATNKMEVNEICDVDLPYQLETEIKLPDMVENCKHAYVNYISNRELNKPIFGYIIRSKNFENTKGFSVIYIESSLMKNIREILYNFTPIFDNMKEKKYNHTKAMFLKSYLCHNTRNHMYNLFFNYINEFNRFDIIINLLVSNIINYKNSNEAEKTNTRLNVLTKKFYYDFKDIINIDIDNCNVIKDLILNINNLEILYDIIYT